LGDGSVAFTPHVLYSDLEHNAVVRPLYHLAKEGRILAEEYPSAEGARGVKARIRPETKLIVALHASNVCGRVLPIGEIGRLAKQMGIPFLVDASQSAGHLPISMKEMGIDVLCLPAHKGLYGPMGAGAAIFSDLKKEYPPFLFGGSGVASLSSDMPSRLPERLEAGSLPFPSLLGLGAAIRYCQSRGVEEMAYHVRRLEERLADRLSSLPDVKLLLPEEHGSGVLSFTHRHLRNEQIAEALNRHGIAVRAGLHCAPVAHRSLGSAPFGTVRIGLGYTNTEKECERFARTLKSILS
ncbi:MAG: aminotransferase class V-fold PLP-dependent enzyme, partial [Clostridia bacterium]|nr:aminotransferase class V-fold PLP-dependent enzyme [Clostridia bacterium]